MKKKIHGKDLSVCDYCGEITFDFFVVSDLWKPNKWKHLHIVCLEKIIGRPLEMYDLVFHPVNKKFLYEYSIYCPTCQYRENNRCVLDGKKCKAWCHLKTESTKKLEGSLMIYKILRRNHGITEDSS